MTESLQSINLRAFEAASNDGDDDDDGDGLLTAILSKSSIAELNKVDEDTDALRCKLSDELIKQQHLVRQLTRANESVIRCQKLISESDLEFGLKRKHILKDDRPPAMTQSATVNDARLTADQTLIGSVFHDSVTSTVHHEAPKYLAPLDERKNATSKSTSKRGAVVRRKDPLSSYLNRMNITWTFSDSKLNYKTLFTAAKAGPRKLSFGHLLVKPQTTLTVRRAVLQAAESTSLKVADWLERR